MPAQKPPKAENINIVRQSVVFDAAKADAENRIAVCIVSTQQRIRDYNWSVGLHERIMLASGFKGLRGGGDTCPFNDTHDDWTINAAIGSARNFQKGDKSLSSNLHFLFDDDLADKAWKLYEGGHVKAVSLGAEAMPGGIVTVQANESAIFDGETYTAGELPLLLYVNYEIFEISMCQRGADKGAVMQADNAADETLRNKEKIMTPEEQAAADALVKQKADPPPTNIVNLEEVRQAAREEGRKAGQKEGVEQAETIRQMGARMRMPEATIKQAVGLSQAAALSLFLSTEEDTAQVVTQAGHVNIVVPNRVASKDGLIASVLQRAGSQRAYAAFCDNLVKQGDEGKRAQEFGERGRYDLESVIRQAVALDGMTPEDSLHDLIRQAMSSTTLANVFTTSINATLLDAYDLAPQTSNVWTTMTAIRNFQDQDMILPENSAKMKLNGRGAPIDHTTLDDAKESWRMYRFASQFVIDEMDIEDDNLDFFSTIPAEFGIQCAELQEDFVYSHLMANAAMRDTVALFHANHGNLGTSATTLAAKVQAGLLAMVNQKIEDAQNTKRKRVLGLRPKALLVPTDLEIDARTLLTSTEMRNTTATTKEGTINPFKDLGLSLVVEPRLSTGCINPLTDANVSGSAVAVYLAADPVRGKGIRVGYSQKTGPNPIVRQGVLPVGKGFGFAYDVQHRRGVKAADWRGLYKHNGA